MEKSKLARTALKKKCTMAIGVPCPRFNHFNHSHDHSPETSSEAQPNQNLTLTLTQNHRVGQTALFVIGLGGQAFR